MSKLLQGNTLSHDNASPLWLSSDSPEEFKKNSIESGFRERWKNIKITYCPDIKTACKNSDLIIIHSEWNEFKQLNFKKGKILRVYKRTK